MKYKINPQAIYTIKKLEETILIIADANSDDRLFSLKGSLFDLFILFDTGPMSLKKVHQKFDQIFVGYDDTKRGEIEQSFEKLIEYGLIISVD